MNVPLDLDDELARWSLSADHFSALCDLGVPVDLLRIRNWCRSARVTVEGPLWRPDPAGSPAVVIPIRGASHVSDDPCASLWYGQAHDAVAFDPRRPTRWAVLSGSAPALGVVIDPAVDPAPIPIWRTPLAWLQADGRGLCLLGADLRERQRIILRLSALIAEDQAHADELRALAEWPPAAPHISFATKPPEVANEAA